MIQRALAIAFVCCFMLTVGTADDAPSEDKPGRLSRVASNGARLISSVSSKAREIRERAINPPPHIGGQTNIPESMVRAGGRIASNFTVEVVRAARKVLGATQELVGKTVAAAGQIIEQAGSRVQHLRKTPPPAGAAAADPKNQGLQAPAAPTVDPSNQSSQAPAAPTVAPNNQGSQQSTQSSSANSPGSPPAGPITNANSQGPPSGAPSASPGLQPNELRKVLPTP